MKLTTTQKAVATRIVPVIDGRLVPRRDRLVTHVLVNHLRRICAFSGDNRVNHWCLALSWFCNASHLEADSKGNKDVRNRSVTVGHGTTKFRTLFISDVHLGARGCQADQLISFLRYHDAETIYLVGDIV
ncbi:MAG: hypothetical protein WBD83_09785, partial [Xanthobacteraceae bacterium]